MSWFKRGDRRSPESVDHSQTEIDPNTCLEVFLNHWKQAWLVMSCQDKRATTASGQATADGVEAVLRNLEQMVTLLVTEDDDGGLPGPILGYALESELLEKICAWCTINVPAHEKLRMQQLRLFELIISQSRQMLLIHKPVIKPLLRLLIDVADSHEISSGELEFKLVLVLHQICICISQQNLILESFFSTDADHGPARFLIFSLLIPYIHREGPVGQTARDALLLIMTLSARHPHIGQYIANNSDFCPVLATGLSGLYSSLPRRITPPTDDWYAITCEDCVRIPDLQMFLNSLQFSNAVVQVAHPLVRKQLIDFIYSGFLVPVLAAALHQISREEVMTATAYLDLFIRHVTEPHLLKAVLKFVLVEKYDDVPVLDSLLSRITSNSHLSTVTLALFYTLIDLNCEDVMFHLVFRYLVPCTHVMVSQRRSVRDLDLYSKSAEKFLSLRPKCCGQAFTENPPSASSPAPPHVLGMASQTHRSSISSISNISSSALTVLSPSSEAASDQQLLWESNYFEYLHDSRSKLEQTMQACLHWSFPYDGERPPPDSIASAEKAGVAMEGSKSGVSLKSSSSQEAAPATGYIELGSILSTVPLDEGSEKAANRRDVKQVAFNLTPAKSVTDKSFSLPKEKCNSGLESDKTQQLDTKLYSSLDNMDTFVNYLNEIDAGIDNETVVSGQSMEKCIADFTDLLKTVPSSGLQRASNMKDDREDPCNKSSDLMDVLSSSLLTTSPCSHPLEIVGDDVSQVTSPSNSQQADFEEIEASARTSVIAQTGQRQSAASNFMDKPLVPSNHIGDNHAASLESDGEHTKRAVNESQASVNSLSPVSSTTTKKERSVPKDLPLSLKLSLSPGHSLSASVFSPMKSPGDLLSPFKSVLTPADEFPVHITSSPSFKKLKYLNDPPNIGPFLSAVFARLEGMISNSLYFNLLLTGVLSRLAAYPQPLLRSFLLNHNLVFQPSVKSLIQVLSSLRQKLDNLSVTIKNFDSLVASARNNLALREDQLLQGWEPGTTPSVLPLYQKPRAETISGAQYVRVPEKKKVTLSDLIFRRSPGKEKLHAGKVMKKHADVEQVQAGDSSFAPYLNNHTRLDIGSSSIIQSDSSAATLSTWNAVYCALILDEFLKELAALSQEHSVLQSDEGYLSS